MVLVVMEEEEAEEEAVNVMSDGRWKLEVDVVIHQRGICYEILNSFLLCRLLVSSHHLLPFLLYYSLLTLHPHTLGHNILFSSSFSPFTPYVQIVYAVSNPFLLLVVARSFIFL